MSASPLLRLTQRLTDPFGFHEAFAGLGLAPEDLPSLTRECRLVGSGQ
ncbi:MAG TPA: hypothetical protein VFH78_06235 [Candidatus Thermoplasmatota archaeon]|nr:hypothetical protein [Candidatus Thermoplasmatota archaeon]